MSSSGPNSSERNYPRHSGVSVHCGAGAKRLARIRRTFSPSRLRRTCRSQASSKLSNSYESRAITTALFLLERKQTMPPSVGLPIRSWRDNSCWNPLSVGSMVRPSSKSRSAFYFARWPQTPRAGRTCRCQKCGEHELRAALSAPSPQRAAPTHARGRRPGEDIPEGKRSTSLSNAEPQLIACTHSLPDQRRRQQSRLLT